MPPSKPIGGGETSQFVLSAGITIGNGSFKSNCFAAKIGLTDHELQRGSLISRSRVQHC